MSTNQSQTAQPGSDPDVGISLKLQLEPGLTPEETMKLAALAANEGKTLNAWIVEGLKKRAAGSRVGTAAGTLLPLLRVPETRSA